MNFIVYFVSINLISFFLMAIDKYRAIKNSYRIPEKVLLFSSFIGGAFGMLLGMYLFHHKTRKLKFKLVYLFFIIWIIVIYYMCESI